MAPQGRRYQLMPSWDELCDLLSARGFDMDLPVKFITYGLREAHAGQRLVRVPARNPGIVLQAVKNVWWDVIMDNGFQVFLVDPQPEDTAHDTVTLLMEVLVPTIDGDVLAPILFEVHRYDDTSVGADESLRADYVDRRANAALIYRLGGVDAQCAPGGSSWCVIEHQRRTYSDIDDRFIVPSGSFIQLQVQPMRWHLLDCSDYFHAANLFATAAMAKVADPTDPSIFVRTHAVDENNHQQGHRSLVIHRRLFKDPSAIWHMTSSLWRDVLQDTSTMRLVYSPTPPQLEAEGRLHIIAMQRSMIARVPIIVSYFLPPEPHDEQPVLIGSFASQIATPTTLRTLRGICLPQGHSRMSRMAAHVWCEDRYHTFHETLRPEAGTHILVFAERDEDPQGYEEGEEEEGTDDVQVSLDADPDCTESSNEHQSTSTSSSDDTGSAITGGSSRSDVRSYSHRNVNWRVTVSLLLIATLQSTPLTMMLIPWITIWQLLDRIEYGELPRRLQPHVSDRWCVGDVQDFSRVPPVCEKLTYNKTLSYGGNTNARHEPRDQYSWFLPINLALGCRHDLVRRPFHLSETSFGGSYDGDIAIALYDNIVRQTYRLSDIPPARDVEVIFGSICQSHVKSIPIYIAILYTRSHYDISRQNAHDFVKTSIWVVGAIFGKLCPPGNPPQSFYIGDEENGDMEENESQHLQVVDVRGVIDLDLLDDYSIYGSTIVITEVHRGNHEFVKIGPSGINDQQLNTLLIPWPPEIICTCFDHIPDIHHLGHQFLACADPFDWDTVEELHIYCDGSTAFCSETGNAFARCAVVITATTQSDNGTGYSVLGFTGGSICTDQDSTHWWGAQNAQSMEAERTAVLLSMLWFLQSPFAIGHRCTIWFDCMAAGYGASGFWNYPHDSTLAELVRGVGQLCEECNPGLFHFEHTHAHVGDPGNELADSAAKAFAQGKLPNLLSRIDIAWLVQSTVQYGSWLWFHFGTYMGLDDLPPLADQCIRLPEPSRLTTAPPSSSFIDKDGGTTSWHVDINIGTVNVKSLYACNDDTDDSMYTPAKATFLSQQLEWGGYGLVGLQECCTKSTGISKIGDFTRVAGESSSRGQLGCEIWLSSKKMHVQVHDICVLHCDERRLVIRVQNASIDLTVASLHSPHSGCTLEERTQWWRQTCSICQRAGKLAPLIVCIDANAQITTSIQHITGDLLDGKENDNEQHLLTLCRLCKVFAPSTFSDIHYNETGTWWHPSGQWLRLDYILVPQEWLTRTSQSWTDTDFDMGSTYDDHRPAGCRMTLVMKKHGPNIARGTYDWSTIDNPQARRDLGNLLQQIPKIPWDTNVHEHATQIHEALHDSMWKVMGPARSTRKACYISESTWATRQGKLKLKKELLNRDKFARITWTLWAFSSWRHNITFMETIRPHLRWMLSFERKSAYIRRALVDTAKDLRRHLHDDRKNFAKQCALRCEGQPLQEVFKELKPLRVGGIFRKRKQPPLPLFRHNDGHVAESPSEIAEIWRAHCAGLEAGEVVTADQLIANAQNARSHRRCPYVSLEDLPTLSVLERHVRKVQCGKAPGCDKIPSAICKGFSRQISRLLYPLLLKQAVSLQEAAEFKGGLLVAAYKNKGRTDDVKSYRGLMLTSILGKTIRSAYRERMLHLYYGFTSDGHFSARHRGNVGQAALVLRLYLRHSKNQQKSCGVIFLDIQHAYYSVCRELASGFTGTDGELCRIFQFFKLPLDTVEDLKRLINSGSAMDMAGCSAFHKSLLHELGTATWYKVKHSDTITQTHGGSRPGDGLADLIFGYIFARMLESMRTAMIEAGIWDPRPWTLGAERSSVLCDGYIPSDIPSNLEVCWADDLALALQADTASGLVERVQATGSFLLRWVKQFGMSPNLSRGKRETLLHLRGPGSRKIKLELFSPEDPTLDILINDEQAVQLRITHQYRHLGGQLHYVGNMVQEVKARCGMAKHAFADYRRKIFSNKNLSLKHRGQLLQSLIYSVLR